MQRLAIAFFAWMGDHDEERPTEANGNTHTEVEREGVATQETNKTIQLSDAILKRRARKAPAGLGLELKGRFGGVGRPLFDIVRFIQL